MQETNVIEQGQAIESVATQTRPAAAPTMTLCSYGNELTQEELALVKTPIGTATHKPIPHIRLNSNKGTKCDIRFRVTPFAD